MAENFGGLAHAAKAALLAAKLAGGPVILWPDGRVEPLTFGSAAIAMAWLEYQRCGKLKRVKPTDMGPFA